MTAAINRRTMLRLLLLAFFPWMHLGCGGGGDSQAGGGIGGTGLYASSVGTVTEFGSVVVNGVTYETRNAQVIVENDLKGTGDGAVIQNLAVGMVVRVEGWMNDDGSGRAEQVFFSADLQGPVESITILDSRTKRVVILGQPVVIDDRTLFRNMATSPIAEGMVLEVSGYADEDGVILATFVGKIADSLLPGGPLKIKGEVQGLDTGAKTFRIGHLKIDYAGATRFPPAGLGTGQFLEVRGRLQAPGLLAADRLDFAEDIGSGAFETIDLEGIVSQMSSTAEFRVGRRTIRTDQATSWKNLLPEDLTPGTRVIVRGVLLGEDILAREIRLFEKVKIRSNVSVVIPAQNGLVLTGFEGVQVAVTADTRIQGRAKSLEEIQPGDQLKVFGRTSPDQTVLASKVLVLPSADIVEITGPLDSVSRPNIVVLGVGINTVSIPAGGFRGRGGGPITADEFLAALRPGDAVAAEGVLQAGVPVWNRLEIQ
jgi:Domain of unknown function (DUF5666)